MSRSTLSWVICGLRLALHVNMGGESEPSVQRTQICVRRKPVDCAENVSVPLPEIGRDILAVGEHRAALTAGQNYVTDNGSPQEGDQSCSPKKGSRNHSKISVLATVAQTGPLPTVGTGFTHFTVL